MTDASFDELLERRIDRLAPTSVTADVVSRWCARFGAISVRHEVSREGWVVPPAMITTFLREPVAPPSGGSASTNVALHDELKSTLGLPVGIAVGYGLECHALVGEGDRLVSVERIAEVGPERDTRFGRGRDWVIEVVSSIADGPRADERVCVERWRMMGYDPSRIVERASASASVDTVTAHAIEPTWTDTEMATREAIVGGATVNRVWAGAHLDDDAAAAAGLPSIILDTSSWVALAAQSSVAWIGTDARLGSVELTMRRPVLVDDVIEMTGEPIADVVDGHDVRWVGVQFEAAVGGRSVASATVHLAVATADGTDVWALEGARWGPRAS